MELLGARGWQVGNVDATILAQRPKLAPYLEQMRENLAARMKAALEQVNVKATTEEKLGFTGAEEGSPPMRCACWSGCDRREQGHIH